MSTPPAAYMQNVCADCEDPLLESERLSASRCIKCQCQMHANCGMRDPRENDVCENCFMRLAEPLRLEERTAVEDALTEIEVVRKALARALEKGAKRQDLLDLGRRLAAAAQLVTDASRLAPRATPEADLPESVDMWGASLTSPEEEAPNE